MVCKIFSIEISCKKNYFVFACITVLIFSGVMMCTAFNSPARALYNTPNDTSYAGSLACRNCHQAIYDSFVTTAHNETFSPGFAHNIKGDVTEGNNSFTYNAFMKVVMEKRADLTYEVSYINGNELNAEPIDIVIGSGRKGQTYLYWKENSLFQLPVSYYTPTNSWCNSPGYPKGIARYNRLIPARCIECHGSNATAFKDADGNTYFDKTSIVYGISCERCHGPAAKHVQYHEEHPNEKNAAFILIATQLSRQQKMDACALCHSGIRQEIQPAFTFKTGDKLDDFSAPTYKKDSTSSLDVHGNQYGLLTASKCFKNSTQLTCSSCHNVHNTELNMPQIFSQRCMSCHTEAAHNTCTIKPVAGLILSNNCIDCHMPKLASSKIFLQTANPDDSSPDYVRTHLIKVYPDATKTFITALKNQQQKK